MTRSDASWCGEAEFGPGADDREVGLVVALGDEPLADLARDVGLGPADQPAGGDLGDDPVGGVGRRGQQRDLVGVLDDPELGRGPATPSSNDASARRSCETEQVPGGEVVRDGDPERARGRGGRPRRDRVADHAGHERVRIVRLLPGHDREVARPRPADTTGPASPRAAARRATGSRAAGMTSIVRRSSGIAG